MEEKKEISRGEAYWKATIGLLVRVLIIWFAASFLAGIVIAPWLDNVRLGGYPLGFWFAQQGSIYGFIALIFYYAYRMGKIDQEHDMHEN